MYLNSRLPLTAVAPPIKPGTPAPQGYYYRRILKAGAVEAHAVVLQPGVEKPYSIRHEGLVVITLAGSMCADLEGRGETPVASMSVSVHPNGQTGSGVVSGEGVKMLILAVPGLDYSKLVAEGRAPPSWTSLGFQALGLEAAVEFSIGDSHSDCALEEIALELMSIGANQVHESSRRPRWWPRLDAILQEPRTRVLSLRAVAYEVGVDPGHLARTHRQVTGMTLGARYRLDRLREACRLLSETSLPIGEIAATVGFTDQPHFAHAMSRAMGFLPSRLRSALAATESRISLVRKWH